MVFGFQTRRLELERIPCFADISHVSLVLRLRTKRKTNASRYVDGALLSM